MVLNERLLELYKKTGGGHCRLTDADFEEYTALRKNEYQVRRDELLVAGCTNVCAKKDESGDIIGWTWEEEAVVEVV